MFKLALRQTQLDPPRTLLTALAIGSVIAVILLLEGFEQGQYHQLEQIVLNRQADLVAAQAGVTNFVAVRSSIPQLSRGEVESIPGVEIAHPITAIPIIYHQDNIHTPVYVMVYDDHGGPSSIIEGHTIRNGREIVIDVSLAEKYQLKPGDSFYVTDFEFKVAGITREAAFMMPFAFINYDGMIDLYIESQIAPDLSTFPMLSYMLIELEPDADTDQVKEAIEDQVPSVDIVLPEQLARNDVNMGRIFFEPIMGLLVSIGYLIGLMVVGLIMYSDVRSRLKTFAVMKALGFSFTQLFLVVLLQSLLLLVLAVPVGMFLAYGTAIFIETASPVYLIRLFDPVVFLQTLTACTGLAIAGALVPLNTIRITDPMIAFQT
ncbi:MAG TPA: ABC transporter permease, partial [Gammaproteobacteria bacterium]